MSIRQTAVPLGGGIGALLLPTLAARAGFGAVYGFLMALCLASVALVLLWLREPHKASPSHTAISPAMPALRNPLVWRLA
ncbi:hypothetical protein ABTD98_19580, partial [Acinetobacter baumannii]